MKLNHFLCLAMLLCAVIHVKAAIFPTELTCEYLDNPAVVDVLQPRLAWINQAEEGERGQKQTAWEIRVASSVDLLKEPDLWQSGKVKSEESNRIEYAGKSLSSRAECWWQVRVWDKNGTVSEWSEPAFWRMGILDSNEWKAKWIGAPWQGEEPLPKPSNPGVKLPAELPPPAPLLRKSFALNKKIKQAVVFVTGLGYFEFYLNGEKVGNDVLVPNQTNYGKRPGLIDENIPLEDHFRDYRVMYLAYDVKDMLQQGNNVAGAIVGNGFYNPAKYWALGYGTPRFIAQIHVVYEDGSEDIIVSDESWKASKSPILMDMVYYGEHYDARLEQAGWNTVDFNDDQWKPVALRKAPYGRLVAHTARPDRIMEELKPVTIRKEKDGHYWVDFGIEVSGWLRLTGVEGPAGHKIMINYLSNEYSGDNTYTLRGEGQESYAARFNWFVFSAVEIINWPGELTADQIRAEVVHTAIETPATFECSNSMFEEINTIWRRSQTDNMHGGVASDCPHRERSAYTGDGQVACVTVLHNYDARNFYHKWIQDMVDAQNPETGYVPNGAPWQPGCGGGVAWGAAICVMPWEFYRHYGSVDLLQNTYEPMKSYLRYMQTWVDDDGIMFSKRTGKDGKILKWFNLGDWVAPGDLPPDDMVHTFYLWYCADILSKTAAVLGEEDDSRLFQGIAEATKQAFFKRFYDPVKHSYGKAGGNIFALKMGVPEEQREQVIHRLKQDVLENNGHLDTGIFGTRFFFEVLSANGLHELAYQAMNKREEPSYGHWLELGATTTRENWNEDGSHNHPMFGGGLVWLYRDLAGMRLAEGSAGYRKIVFRPQLIEELDYVSYYNKTSYGRCGIDWKKQDQKLQITLTVPVGCQAEVHVPLLNARKITESQQFADQAESVRFLYEKEDARIYAIGSGTYHFLSE